jgi:hypothetical protein
LEIPLRSCERDGAGKKERVLANKISESVRVQIEEMMQMVADQIGIEHQGPMVGKTGGRGMLLEGASRYWNPLTDDKVSREVQVALDIDLFIRSECAEAVGPLTEVCRVEYPPGDRSLEAKRAAARLAVFEAAAKVVERRADRRRNGGE